MFPVQGERCEKGVCTRVWLWFPWSEPRRCVLKSLIVYLVFSKHLCLSDLEIAVPNGKGYTIVILYISFFPHEILT